ncbi:MAG: LysR family transcriptional regulator, partial [Pseudomonadota bacterium]
MDHWSELRTAWLVAKLGTVSAAAHELGVHRATVNRHIATLEGALGATLFQRHARGYSPTDTGRDMLEVAGRANEMFADLQGRARGRASQLSGELIVTALAGVAPLIMPAIARFQAAYPAIAVDFVAGAQLARLEYGEAHVAVRAGSKPDARDYIVLPFRRIRFGVYAHRSYVERFGIPSGQEELSGHRFVGALGNEFRAPFIAWMTAHVPYA